ncbi:TPA_exp: Uncharacterized protein A8136_5504 [Trichophyton benhamiae CBS 112371]|nr:TPA_exp: Uncharacterized protein A8136_5504 [Trichophyton benhamiae CBS 112371]
MTEEEELLAKIGQLAEAASTATSSSTPSNEAPDSKPGIKNSWIAKRDRHMQLINSSIFDQETQARNKAIAETRRLKAQKKAAREESMVLRHAQSASRFSENNRSEAQPDGRAYTIYVGDIPFQVAQGGSKLISLSSEDMLLITIRSSRISLWFIDDPLKANVTPKRVKVGGVTFVRSKRGNLHRLGAVVSKKAGQIRKFTANKVDPSAEGDSEEDVSSDDEVFEEIDSDDVDSDDLEEPEEIVQGTDGGDASQQLDFIGFS